MLILKTFSLFSDINKTQNHIAPSDQFNMKGKSYHAFRTDLLIDLAFSDVFCYVIDIRSTEEIFTMMSGLCKRIGIMTFLLALAILNANASLGKIQISNSST